MQEELREMLRPGTSWPGLDWTEEINLWEVPGFLITLLEKLWELLAHQETCTKGGKANKPEPAATNLPTGRPAHQETCPQGDPPTERPATCLLENLHTKKPAHQETCLSGDLSTKPTTQKLPHEEAETQNPPPNQTNEEALPQPHLKSGTQSDVNATIELGIVNIKTPEHQGNPGDKRQNLDITRPEVRP